MKRYKFAFGGVQRVRRIAEEQARMAMLSAQHDAEVASAELHHRLEEIGSARPAPGSRTVAEFQADRDHLERHRQAVLAARSAEINALELLGSARAEWLAAAQELRVLDRLDERQHAEWLLETTHAAQLLTDEIATIRFTTEQQR